MSEYPIPGAWVREFTVEVPLDWTDPERASIRVFVRELTDPDRFAPAMAELAAQATWSPLYDPDRLAVNEVPLAAAVHADDVFVDAGLQQDTLARIGAARAWVTNEFEHDGIRSGRVFTRLREMIRDRGGERR
jgi:hypothetical protein